MKIASCSECRDFNSTEEWWLQSIADAFFEKGRLTSDQAYKLDELNRKAYAIRMSRERCRRFS